MKFYNNRTVWEQRARLPQSFRANYSRTVLDRIEIDGNVIQGYMEYSFLNEKSYFEEPYRSSNGSIENINTYATFLTPRIIIKYSMMNIEDYRKLMLLMQSKNEFKVTCYDPVLDKRVTHRMYFAPTSMPVIYQQYLKAMGVQDFTVELIGTNNGVGTHTLTYDFNIPSDMKDSFPYTKTATQDFYENTSGIIGEEAVYNIGTTEEPQVFNINSSKTTELLGGRYIFSHWNTLPDGMGFTYIDGDAYFINSAKTIYAIWKKG